MHKFRKDMLDKLRVEFTMIEHAHSGWIMQTSYNRDIDYIIFIYISTKAHNLLIWNIKHFGKLFWNHYLNDTRGAQFEYVQRHSTSEYQGSWSLHQTRRQKTSNLLNLLDPTCSMLEQSNAGRCMRHRVDMFITLYCPPIASRNSKIPRKRKKWGKGTLYRKKSANLSSKKLTNLKWLMILILSYLRMSQIPRITRRWVGGGWGGSGAWFENVWPLSNVSNLVSHE